MNRITLHEIAVGGLEGEGEGEQEREGEGQQLSTLSPEALQALKKEETQYQITVMEERLEQLSPNMAAIEAYRKKVSACFSFLFLPDTVLVLVVSSTRQRSINWLVCICCGYNVWSYEVSFN